MVRQLSDVGAPNVKHRKPLSAQTVRYAHAILSGALEQAVRWQMLPGNAARHVQLPKNERREMRALSSEEASAFCKALEGDRFEAYFVLLLGTGLRPGEARALRWSDVDFNVGRLTVQRTLPRRRQGDEIEFEDPKTARSRRVVPLPATVNRVLRQHRARQATERLQLGDSYATELDLVFTNEIGEPVNERNLVRRHFKPALGTAKLLGTLRVYDLRHSFASLAMAAGAHVKAVSDRLGHASTKMTLDVYSHVLEPVEKDATERIEDAIFNG